jgi:hypothetical protein
MLEGRFLAIFMDHKLLTFDLKQSTDSWTIRQWRKLSYIAKFTDDIQHIKGIDNQAADTPASTPDDRPAPPLRLMSPLQSRFFQSLAAALTKLPKPVISGCVMLSNCFIHLQFVSKGCFYTWGGSALCCVHQGSWASDSCR